MKRHSLVTVYGHLYSYVPGNRSDEGYNECVYCGDPADTRDHVPPLTRIDDYRAIGLETELYLLVSACSECNSLLGNSLQDTIFERIHEAKARLRDKCKKVERLPSWSDCELDDLEGILRQDVQGNIRQRDRFIDRVSYEYGNIAISDQIPH